MISRRIFAALALLCGLIAPAHAQKTKALLNTEIGVQFPDNTVNAITPLNLRNVTSDIVNSIMPTAPVTAGNLACFSGITGLLQDCGQAPNVFTATLPGIVPASGGGTANFLTAAGTWVGARPIFNITSPSFGAKADFQQLADGAITTGTASFTSATAGFSAGAAPAGSVGKLVDIVGAGAAGAVLHSSISAFVNSTTVTLANNAGTTVSGANFDVGTDNAAAINSAIAAGCTANQNSEIYIPAGGVFGVTKINMTGLSGCMLFGDGWNVSRLYPMGTYSTTTGHVIDRTQSLNTTLKDFQIGAFNLISTPATAIFDAQTASAVANQNFIDNVYASGNYTTSCYYNFAVPSSSTFRFKCYNYNPGSSSYVKIFTNTNPLGLASSFFTVAAAGQSPGNFVEYAQEAHAFTGVGPAIVWFDGVLNYSGAGAVISGGAVSYVKLTAANQNISFVNSPTFETESQTPPTNAFNLLSGSLNGFHCDQCSYITAGNLFTGAGSLSTFKNGSSYNFNTGTASGITQNTTSWVGMFGFSTVSANVIGQLPTVAGTFANLHVFVNVAPGGAQTYTVTLYVNGASASTCTITGAATGCSDSNHFVNTPAGAIVALQVVSSATAAATNMSASVEYHPFQ